MIRTNVEYREAKSRLEAERTRLESHRQELLKAGLSVEQVDLAMQPLQSFHQQLVEEVDHYERLKRGDFCVLENLRGLGGLLVGLRIAQGLTQRELAERLGIHESQVSRDERNEYFNVTIERVNRILDVLGVRLHTKVEAAPLKTDSVS